MEIKYNKQVIKTEETVQVFPEEVMYFQEENFRYIYSYKPMNRHYFQIGVLKDSELRSYLIPYRNVKWMLEDSGKPDRVEEAELLTKILNMINRYQTNHRLHDRIDSKTISSLIEDKINGLKERF